MLKALVAAIVVELCCPSLKLPAITLSQKREQLATSEATTASSKELQSLHETLVQKQGQLRSLYDEMQNVLCIDFKADTPLKPEQLAAAVKIVLGSEMDTLKWRFESMAGSARDILKITSLFEDQTP